MASAFDSVGDKGRVRTKIRERKKKKQTDFYFLFLLTKATKVYMASLEYIRLKIKNTVILLLIFKDKAHAKLLQRHLQYQRQQTATS